MKELFGTIQNTAVVGIWPTLAGSGTQAPSLRITGWDIPKTAEISGFDWGDEINGPK